MTTYNDIYAPRPLPKKEYGFENIFGKASNGCRAYHGTTYIGVVKPLNQSKSSYHGIAIDGYECKAPRQEKVARMLWNHYLSNQSPEIDFSAIEPIPF